jgi:putative acetyltransferase
VKAAVIAIADPAEPSIRALIEILDGYLSGLYPAESNHLLDIEALRQPEMRFFAARAGENVLGCGGCWLHEDYAEIKRVYVSPRARGLGLAKRLMQRIEEEAVAHGRTIARLESGICQPEALGLYRKLGYSDCGPFGDYPDDPNSVFMEKVLG